MYFNYMSSITVEDIFKNCYLFAKTEVVHIKKEGKDQESIQSSTTPEQLVLICHITLLFIVYYRLFYSVPLFP